MRESAPGEYSPGGGLCGGATGDSLPHAPFARVWRFQLGCLQVADVRRWAGGELLPNGGTARAFRR